MKLRVTELDFLEKKKFCPKYSENGLKMGQKQGFSNLVINFYRICSEFVFVLMTWAKMLLANQTAGFFNQPYLQYKSMKQSDFWHVNTKSKKLELVSAIFHYF